jgi:multidrug efflux pump subunit AcrA (membrane-fusion protein)
MSRSRTATFGHRLFKPWIVMPLVALVAVGIWLGVRSSNGTSATGSAQQSATVTRGSMARTITASGTVAAAQTDDLSFTSAGTVTAVNVAAGATVTKGEVLASIDSTDLAAAVSSAESSLAAAQAQLADDRAAGASSDQLAADQASVTTAQDDLDQADTALAGANLVATFDGTVASVDLTVGEQLSSSGTGGTTTTGTGSRSGRTANDLGTSGPQGGSGAGGQTGAGASASSGSTTPQISVISSGRYTVTLDVASADVADVKVGQSATVALSTSAATTDRRAQFLAAFGGGAFGGQGARNGNGGSGTSASSTTLPADVAGSDATGTVTSVGAVASATSGVATYPVVVSFTGSAGTFQPGATVNATITYAQLRDAIQVPTRAVTTTDSGSTVTIVKGSSHRTVAVTLGVTWNGMSQVTKGLLPGQTVLLPSFTIGGRPGGSTRGTSGNTGRGFGGDAPGGFGGEPPGGFGGGPGGGAP